MVLRWCCPNQNMCLSNERSYCFAGAQSRLNTRRATQRRWRAGIDDNGGNANFKSFDLSMRKNSTHSGDSYLPVYRQARGRRGSRKGAQDIHKINPSKHPYRHSQRSKLCKRRHRRSTHTRLRVLLTTRTNPNQRSTPIPAHPKTATKKRNAEHLAWTLSDIRTIRIILYKHLFSFLSIEGRKPIIIQ
jgi:hypothetical protein